MEKPYSEEGEGKSKRGDVEGESTRLKQSPGEATNSQRQPPTQPNRLKHKIRPAPQNKSKAGEVESWQKRKRKGGRRGTVLLPHGAVRR
ncbi:hypothetical protein GBA52_010718 [Prunus armeniaca]|nr:hypothetical protein GBA52_010718 [Prunus armeniaca]